jgi:L-malate glycosyltransferase
MKAEVRVLQVVLSLHPGGTERLVLELVSRLRAEMPMAVCCLDESGAWADEALSQNVSVSSLGRRPGFRPMLGKGIADAARRHGATVIHAHHYSPFVYSAIGRLWGGPARIVFTEHGRLSDVGPSSKRRLANQLLSRVARDVFTVSGDLRQHLIEEGFEARRVGVIYNGIDVGALPQKAARDEARRRIGATDDDLVVGTVARLDPVKDLQTLIGGIAAAGTRPLRLIVIGDGPDRATLERVAREAGIADRVQFLGHRDDARSWLGGCDVYANTSISEGISLTILEAMAAGLPVVATRVGGTPEIVDETHGRLVPARDREAVAAALRELGGQPELRQRMGAAGRAKVEARFTIERMVRDYAEVYAGSGRKTRS